MNITPYMINNILCNHPEIVEVLERNDIDINRGLMNSDNNIIIMTKTAKQAERVNDIFTSSEHLFHINSLKHKDKYDVMANRIQYTLVTAAHEDILCAIFAELPDKDGIGIHTNVTNGVPYKSHIGERVNFRNIHPASTETSENEEKNNEEFPSAKDIMDFLDCLIETANESIKEELEHKKATNKANKFKPEIDFNTPWNGNANKDALSIKDVKFNKNATIIFFSDNTKAVAKCDTKDEFNPIAGFSMALCKRLIGNQNFRSLIETYCFDKQKEIYNAKNKGTNTAVPTEDTNNT